MNGELTYGGDASADAGHDDVQLRVGVDGDAAAVAFWVAARRRLNADRADVDLGLQAVKEC